jgi:hypothetical protein
MQLTILLLFGFIISSTCLSRIFSDSTNDTLEFRTATYQGSKLHTLKIHLKLLVPETFNLVNVPLILVNFEELCKHEVSLINQGRIPGSVVVVVGGFKIFLRILLTLS